MARIGFDLRALQIGHQYRGIGEVVRQTVKKVIEMSDDAEIEPVFFQYEDGTNVADAFLPKECGETVFLPHNSRKFTKLMSGGMTTLQEGIIKNKSDIFVQFDFELGIPKGHENIMVVHDQIPHTFGNKYPHSYHSTYKAGRRAGLRRRHALKKDMLRRLYEKNLASTLERASIVLTVSDYTRTTTEMFTQKQLDIRVMHLGHDVSTGKHHHLSALERARIDDLGLIKGNFLFFIGGVDERRRIDELVDAYNQLRADGADIHLVLAGYDFQSLDHIYSPRTRANIENSSYIDNIHLFGFVSNTEREWLYENALAFVFPTEAEGFGIPLIESLSVGCSVITYDRTAISELAGPNVYLADSWLGIADAAKKIMSTSPDEAQAIKTQGIEWASRFTWMAAAKVMMQAIEDVKKK